MSANVVPAGFADSAEAPQVGHGTLRCDEASPIPDRTVLASVPGLVCLTGDSDPLAAFRRIREAATGRVLTPPLRFTWRDKAGHCSPSRHPRTGAALKHSPGWRIPTKRKPAREPRSGSVASSSAPSKRTAATLGRRNGRASAKHRRGTAAPHGSRLRPRTTRFRGIDHLECLTWWRVSSTLRGGRRPRFAVRPERCFW
jgi:hypothetical protein